LLAMGTMPAKWWMKKIRNQNKPEVVFEFDKRIETWLYRWSGLIILVFHDVGNYVDLWLTNNKPFLIEIKVFKISLSLSLHIRTDSDRQLASWSKENPQLHTCNTIQFARFI
jgi:hypothetical protein